MTSANKQCSGLCNRVLPNTGEFFPVRWDNAGKTRNKCRQCYNAEKKIWRDSVEGKKTRQKWRAENKDVSNAINRKWRKNNKLEQMLHNARGRAKKRNMEFCLTSEDISIPDFCPVLRIPLFFTENTLTPNTPSLDRIDNTKGYIKGNVVIVSWRANSIKSDASLDELEKIVSFYRGISSIDNPIQ